MIERLVVSLRTLRRIPADDLTAEAHARLRADCADAVRLELDCQQQTLTASEREALLRLSELLEERRSEPAELAAAVRRACDELHGRGGERGELGDVIR